MVTRVVEDDRRQLVTTDSAPTTAGRLERALFNPVDSAFLATIRMVYGVTMFARAWYYVGPSETGRWFYKTHEYFLDPDFHFSYYGFEWVKTLPTTWMYALFILMTVLSVCVTLGLFYRVTSVLLCIGYVYVFTIDKALFLNHYYLLSLMSFLMCLVPANCVLSLDAWLRPSLRSDVVPTWTLWLLRFQIAVPYFFGGIAKLNSDWLHGEPIRKWLHSGFMGLGREWLHNEFAVAFVSYGGVLFDLMVVPLLLWRRTRVPAFLAVIVFNLCNTQLFRIGVFPWFMLFGSTLFFSPGWHRRVLGSILPWISKLKAPEVSDDAHANTLEGGAMSSLYERMCRPARRRVRLAFLAVWVTFQIVWPSRHHLYGGQPAWTGKGDLFAWRMMLYDKTGAVRFFRVDHSNSGATAKQQRIEIPVRVLKELPQERQRSDSATSGGSNTDFVALNGYQQIMLQRDPDLIHQFCRYLGQRFRNADGTDAEIYVDANLSYNTRKPQALIDPNVNMAAVPRTAFGPTPWIVPFDNSPRRRLDQALHDLPPLPAKPPQAKRETADEDDAPRYTTPDAE